MDYGSKTYSDPIRDAAEGRVKPQNQKAEEGERAKVSRATSTMFKVITSEETTKVEVREREGERERGGGGGGGRREGGRKGEGGRVGKRE